MSAPGGHAQQPQHLLLVAGQALVGQVERGGDTKLVAVEVGVDGRQPVLGTVQIGEQISDVRALVGVDPGGDDGDGQRQVATQFHQFHRGLLVGCGHTLG